MVDTHPRVYIDDGAGNIVGGASNPLVVASQSSGGSPTDRSAASTATSSQLMPVNASRKKWVIQAPLAADLWFAFGQNASIGGAGSYRIPAGGIANSSGVVEQTAINTICGTAGLQIAAFDE